MITHNILAAADESLPEKLGGVAERIAVDFQIEWPYFIAQIVNFLIVAFLLYRFAFKPILATMADRQARIQAGLDYTEEMQRQLANTKKQQEETLAKASAHAQEIIAQARENAKALVEKETQNAAHRAEAMLHTASEAAQAERKQMIADVRAEVVDLVVETTEKVLEQKLEPAQAQTYAETATTILKA